MLKIMTIVGTRPELIKMSRVIAEFDKHTNHILVHTGQNYDYELNKIFFDDLDIRSPDHFLGVMGETPVQVIAQILEKSDLIMEREKPDAILLYGDTNSCLSVIAAKRRKIPVFHMEAGNRCFDERVPEELNRKIVDHLSDVNLVLTEHARQYLISEGVRPELIMKTGSHMGEVLAYYMPKIDNSSILMDLGLDSKKYFLVSIHREENVDSDENMKNLVETLNVLATTYNIPVIVSTHPRTRKKLDLMNLGMLDEKIKFMRPFGFCDYIKLQMEAKCVLSDSGTITEEAALLNLSAITIRDAHERPEGMDAGTLIMTGLKSERVLNAVTIVVSRRDTERRNLSWQGSDQEKNVSRKILQIVFSYIDYINRTIWFKPGIKNNDIHPK